MTADPLTTLGAEAYCTIVDGKVVYQASKPKSPIFTETIKMV